MHNNIIKYQRLLPNDTICMTVKIYDLTHYIFLSFHLSEDSTMGMPCFSKIDKQLKFEKATGSD